MEVKVVGEGDYRICGERHQMREKGHLLTESSCDEGGEKTDEAYIMALLGTFKPVEETNIIVKTRR